MRKKLFGTLSTLVLLGTFVIPFNPVSAATGVLDHVEITAPATTVPAGGTIQFAAQGYDDGNVAVTTNVTYAWTVVNGGGSINETGLFTAGDVNGTCTNTVEVIAVQDGNVENAKFGFATVTVSYTPGPLDHVLITPASASVCVNGTEQFAAQGYDANNVALSDLAFTWNVVAGGGAINETGFFTAGEVAGNFPDTVQAIAAQGDVIKTATASVTVTPAPGTLDHVVVIPADVTIAANGSQQFSAQAYDIDNQAIADLTYTWSVVAGGGTINGTGLFTAGTTVGTFANTVKVEVVKDTITKSAFASVNVTAEPTVLDHVQITPSTASVAVNGTVQFTAEGHDVNHAVISGLSFTWTVLSGDGTINSTGLFTAGDEAGTCTIQAVTAKDGTIKSATATVTVTANNEDEDDEDEDEGGDVPDFLLPPGLRKNGKWQKFLDRVLPPGWSKGNKTGWNKSKSK